MIIEYLGHSCFYIKGEDYSVVTDPFGDIGYRPKRVRCDYALSSHDHFDHNGFDAVDAKVRVNAQNPHPLFRAIPCFHDDAGGTKRGQNTAYYFEVEGIRVLHLGDLGERFSKEGAEKFKLPVDILFIPVGGNYTIDAGEAAKYANYIGARVTIPMHYKTKRSKIDIGPVRDFLNKTGEWETADNPSVIQKKDLDGLPPVLLFDFE